jgi:hypothetical protein
MPNHKILVAAVPAEAELAVTAALVEVLGIGESRAGQIARVGSAAVRNCP